MTFTSHSSANIIGLQERRRTNHLSHLIPLSSTPPHAPCNPECGAWTCLEHRNRCVMSCRVPVTDMQCERRRRSWERYLMVSWIFDSVSTANAISLIGDTPSGVFWNPFKRKCSRMERATHAESKSDDSRLQVRNNPLNNTVYLFLMGRKNGDCQR